MTLSPDERARYARQIVLDRIGPEGQRKLIDSSVVIVGTGGLGSPAALYLAAAGVGHIGLIDFDEVDRSNLHRQILHDDDLTGTVKTTSAKARLEALNPSIQVTTHQTRLTSGNALEILNDYDVILDGSDNFPTRYLVNDAAVLLGKPNVYGSIFRFEGQSTVFGFEGGACYRCIFPEPPPPGTIPDCAEAGVLGVLPGVIGTIQATEAIKIILGVGEILVNRLLLYDSLAMQFREIRLKRDSSCPVCGDEPAITELVDYEAFCGLQKEDLNLNEVEVTELKRRLDEESDSFVLLDVREPHEAEIADIEGSTMIPLGQLKERLDELDKSKEHLVFCRSGKRSGMAVHFLTREGFQASNVKGGILAWSDEVDPTVPKY